MFLLRGTIVQRHADSNKSRVAEWQDFSDKLTVRLDFTYISRSDLAALIVYAVTLIFGEYRFRHWNK